MLEFKDRPAMQAAAAVWIADQICDALARRGQALMLAAGGSTPAPVYQALARMPLDWTHVTVGLTDERWVDEDHPASNTAMLKSTLLTDAAASAHFLEMKVNAPSPDAGAAQVNATYVKASLSDVMLVGMGADAHTLSWFADARGFKEAVDPNTPHRVVAIDAPQTEVTGPWTQRMTLTLPCVAGARSVVLLITGEDKRAVFLNADDTTPIGRLCQAAGRALTVFYSS